MYELKACPFCNGKAGLYLEEDDSGYVLCQDCGVETLWDENIKDAIEGWNRRDYRENEKTE